MWSLATPDAPTTERGFTTADQKPDEHNSEHGAFRVAETSERTLGVTMDADRVTALPPVPEIHHDQENTRGQYLAEATLVSQHDVLIGEIVEEPKDLWRQPKVQRLAFFLSVAARNWRGCCRRRCRWFIRDSHFGLQRYRHFH
jgi:hypothetical protein